MSVPVLTFFNNKGGVGKTSLVYHLAWMFSELGLRIVAVDLDPQANLTTAFLPEDALEKLWEQEDGIPGAATIARCVEPLTKVGDIAAPCTVELEPRLHLVPGDLALAAFEDVLSQEWPNSLSDSNLYRPFRVLTAFWQIAQMAADRHQADLILTDVGPNLGAINRSALIGTDHVAIPLAADIFSIQGLRNLGPTLRRWRNEWSKRLHNWSEAEFALPKGRMEPIGYILQQHSERLRKPVQAYQKWASRIPDEYRRSVLGSSEVGVELGSDPLCLARVKNYRSLVPMAQEATKPIFHLNSADGAIGSHSYAVIEARKDFRRLAEQVLSAVQIMPPLP